MPGRRTLLALVSVAASLVVAPAAQAADSPPVITKITTENNGGGLTPYVPLFTTVAVTFTDPTPSAETDYLVRVPGAEVEEFLVFATGKPDTFVGQVPGHLLTAGAESEFTVVEHEDGKVVGTSAPEAFTFTYVGHPRRLSTSSTKVRGQWSYRAGTRARLRFRGKWEPGTTITTQVWVSRAREFTSRDYTFNTRKKGALVQRSGVDKTVLSFRVPRKHIGKYVWVSVMGWKNGKGGWSFEVPAERIIRR
jgi:hypothetical protein